MTPADALTPERLAETVALLHRSDAVGRATRDTLRHVDRVLARMTRGSR